ncbi:sensor histidine kinase [Herbidospora galbida]|uniref:histidine kinase n=1 Tax=Herbidospora galbida TaxID=2575442 RepID=A0A4U3ME10_9ACTN|nr:histidine kinase [Herbidospora galbida]TKK86592.1 sensor histidine kinase [Herbidospora galbida]
MDVSPRRPRDWIVDSLLFGFAVGFGLLTASMRVPTLHLLPHPALFYLDQVLAVAGCAAVWWRRRHPTGLAVIMVVVSAWSELIAGATIVALFNVAVHRPPRVTGGVFGLSVLSCVVFVVLRPDPADPGAAVFLLGSSIYGMATGWGMVIHHRRQLAASRRDREAQMATEVRLRAEQAQLQARETIAREMHDVLGHRLSLLSVHAGALEFRPDAPPEDVARAAKIIRESAHLALQDLRDVIGVLRAPVRELPQPTLAEVGRLTEESARAGMRVTLTEKVDGEVPGLTGRTGYRIVQEGLTNARKHAPGADVEVSVTGAPEAGLTIEVRNTRPSGEPAADRPGGQGLAGLAERVALAGGTLTHGGRPDGGWALTAWLPWPA